MEARATSTWTARHVSISAVPRLRDDPGRTLPAGPRRPPAPGPAETSATHLQGALHLKDQPAAVLGAPRAVLDILDAVDDRPDPRWLSGAGPRLPDDECFHGPDLSSRLRVNAGGGSWRGGREWRPGLRRAGQVGDDLHQSLNLLLEPAYVLLQPSLSL